MLYVYSYAKEETTQLVWKFAAADQGRCPAFPLGVKTLYRAYSENEVIEIVPDRSPQNPAGMIARKCRVNWAPMASEHNNNSYDGMFILKQLPRAKLLPAMFPSNSRSALMATINKVRNSNMSTEVIDEWNKFSAIAPADEDVFAYCMRDPLYVPLKSQLFQYVIPADDPMYNFAEQALFDNRVVIQNGIYNNNQYILEQVAVCLDCVVWPNRGNPLPFIPARVTLDGADDTVASALLRNALAPHPNYAELTVAQLKQMCEMRDITVPTSGGKDAIIQVLKSYDNGKHGVPVLSSNRFSKKSISELKAHLQGLGYAQNVNSLKKQALVDLCIRYDDYSQASGNKLIPQKRAVDNITFN